MSLNIFFMTIICKFHRSRPVPARGFPLAERKPTEAVWPGAMCCSRRHRSPSSLASRRGTTGSTSSATGWPDHGQKSGRTKSAGLDCRRLCQCTHLRLAMCSATGRCRRRHGLQRMNCILRVPRGCRNFQKRQCAESFFFRQGRPTAGCAISRFDMTPTVGLPWELPTASVPPAKTPPCPSAHSSISNTAPMKIRRGSTELVRSPAGFSGCRREPSLGGVPCEGCLWGAPGVLSQSIHTAGGASSKLALPHRIVRLFPSSRPPIRFP